MLNARFRSRLGLPQGGERCPAHGSGAGVRAYLPGVPPRATWRGPPKRGRSMASNEDARAAAEAKLDELHEKLTGAVESLVSVMTGGKALAFAARFRSRSFNNTMLIWVQHEAAFEAGRVPNPSPPWSPGTGSGRGSGAAGDEGQPGYMIFAPVTGRFASESCRSELVASAWDRGRSRRSTRSCARGWSERGRPTWDASQTDGEPLPVPPAPTLLEGEAPRGCGRGWPGRFAGRVRGAAGAARGDDLRRERHDRLRGAHGRGAGEHGPCRAGQDPRARARARW